MKDNTNNEEPADSDKKVQKNYAKVTRISNESELEEKYSFLLPFRQTRNLLEYLVGYKPEDNAPKKTVRKKAK